MDQKIYILRNRKLIRGPYNLQALKSKLLSKDDLIWYQGLPDWTRAHLIDQVKELFAERPQTAHLTVLQKVKNIFG
ncbi:MAG: DUF4339 domain-containing protein [Sphingobacteriia bacterium]|nr:MAG: DUF4339 domain-containing protein [Sphingobacteriia bacterium]TAG31055.1 MAG: DUF4339 domain-containing protein [Sphingobacteriia bacterium]TAH08355.1 MAG: DUF4339 domain-containing protein [Sphingobacteriia bacterium]